MPNWTEFGTELENMLRLKTKIIAYRRLEKAEELENIKNVVRLDRFFPFCQVPFTVRVNGVTVGITKEDKIQDRCTRIFGLRSATEKSMNAEAAMLSTTWFRSPEEALQQQGDYYRIPVGEAIVLAPLTKQKFEPEVLLAYGNPARIKGWVCQCGTKLDFDKKERTKCSQCGKEYFREGAEENARVKRAGA